MPSEKILLAELGEAQRCLETKLESPHLSETARAYFTRSCERLRATSEEWAQFKVTQIEVTREMMASLRAEVREAIQTIKMRESDDLGSDLAR